MIELKVEAYCQNCAEFETETDRALLYAGDEVEVAHFTVICVHRRKCAIVRQTGFQEGYAAREKEIADQWDAFVDTYGK